MSRNTPLVALFLVVLLALTPVAAVAIGQVSAGAAGNSSSSGGDGNGDAPTLQELRNDGTHYENSPPSVRISDSHMYWIEHLPASNPTASIPKDLEKLPENHVLERNKLYLRTIRASDSEKATVKVAYWNQAKRTVTDEDGSERTVRVAENVTVEEHRVTLGLGWPLIEIPLDRHDQTTRVTMWIEGKEGARWTFRHKSVATSRPAHIDTQGDYWWSMFVDVLIWIILGGLVISALVMKAIGRAGRGPGYGVVPYLFVLALTTAFGMFVYYDSVASILVNAPMIPALYIVALIGIFILETYSSGVRKVQFIKPKLAAATSPSGEDGYDLIGGETKTFDVVRMKDGRDAVVRQGVFPFLARVFGKAAYIEGIGDLKTRLELEDSKIDEMYWIDPEADELLEFQAPGWTFDVPEISRENASKWAGALGVLSISAMLVRAGAFSATSTALGLGLAGAVVCLKPTDGHARVDPATAYYRSAWASMLYLSTEIEDAETIDVAKDQLRRERARSWKDIESELEQHDSTIINEMVASGRIPATIQNDDAPGSVLEELETDSDRENRENGEVTSNDD